MISAYLRWAKPGWRKGLGKPAMVEGPFRAQHRCPAHKFMRQGWDILRPAQPTISLRMRFQSRNIQDYFSAIYNLAQDLNVSCQQTGPMERPSLDFRTKRFKMSKSIIPNGYRGSTRYLSGYSIWNMTSVNTVWPLTSTKDNMGSYGSVLSSSLSAGPERFRCLGAGKCSLINCAWRHDRNFR